MKALTNQLSNFANVICSDELPEICDADALESVRTIESAYQSLRTGEFLDVNPVSMAETATLAERKFSVLTSNKASSTA